jgi:hypothetical protein
MKLIRMKDGLSRRQHDAELLNFICIDFLKIVIREARGLGLVVLFVEADLAAIYPPSVNLGHNEFSHADY